MARSGPHYYAVYELVVETDEPFGEWPVPRTNSTATPDVRVRWHEVLPQSDRASLLFQTSIGGSDVLRVFEAAGGSLWCYPDEASFWISRDGSVIQCAGPPHFSQEDLATYLLGPILGFVLRQRGRTILHASTIQVGPDAVAITGPAGAGKSTLTAALTTRGHTLIAEDVSVLDDDAPRVAPGSPFIKLWPDSATRHGNLPLLTPNWEKRYLEATLGSGRPLRRIYVLETADTVSSVPLRGRDALVALVDNAYLTYALSGEQRAGDLARFARLIDNVAVIRLQRSADYGDLDELCTIIERPT